MKIYTKTGDAGETSLLGGTRVAKNHDRIEAYGSVDELNSFLGLLISAIPKELEAGFLKDIQAQLFAIGSVLAAEKPASWVPKVKSEWVTKIEQTIDEMNAELAPLKNFILPGGSEATSRTHICRTICRRAERNVVKCKNDIDASAEIIIYLNRLSDYFFVLARWIGHHAGVDEEVWNPNEK